MRVVARAGAEGIGDQVHKLPFPIATPAALGTARGRIVAATLGACTVAAVVAAFCLSFHVIVPVWEAAGWTTGAWLGELVVNLAAVAAGFTKVAGRRRAPGARRGGCGSRRGGRRGGWIPGAAEPSRERVRAAVSSGGGDPAGPSEVPR